MEHSYKHPPIVEAVIEIRFKAADHQQVAAAIKAIRASKLDVKPLSGFAIGQVEQIDSACANYKKKVRFIHEPEDDNKGHTAIHGWPRDADDLFEALAAEAWSETVLNKNIPA